MPTHEPALYEMSRTVVIDFGFGGAWDTAIQAAERLNDEALAYTSSCGN